MYIKLIQPKMIKRPMDTDIKTHMSPPLGLYTIVNMFRNEHEVVVENENVESVHLDDAPDVVGISVTVDTFPRAVEIAKSYRKRGIPVIAGGIFVTTASEYIPKDRFDALCIGAAELTWNQIIEDLQKGCLQPVYRCPRSMTGADIISPAYDRIPKDKYLYCNIVHTSRGCPYRCDFCYNSAAERQYLNRPVSDVLEDIKMIGSQHIMFIDDNFAGNNSWTEEFLQAIEPLHLKWNAAVSIDIVRHESLLDHMKKCGCQSLFIGFESINQTSLNGVRKVQNHVEEYEKAVDIIHKKGLMINASFVFGLDSDQPTVFRDTLDWIVKNKIETVTSHILTPYPGTALYRELQTTGRIMTEDLSLYNTAHVVFQPLNMTPEELYQGYIRIYKNIYSLKNIIKRIPKEKSQIAPYLLFNLFYRKYGRFTDLLCKHITYKRIGAVAQKIVKYL